MWLNGSWIRVEAKNYLDSIDKNTSSLVADAVPCVISKPLSMAAQSLGTSARIMKAEALELFSAAKNIL
jgi:hypothetical protein